MKKQEAMKKAAAEKAVEFIKNNMIVGVGTGSTVRYFVEALALVKHKIEGAVASSLETEEQLKKQGIPLYDLNAAPEVSIYVDGADEFNQHFYLIKGGGGALTREKIIAAVARQFVCIVDSSKQVDVLGKFPLAIEVIPMARSYVAREIVKLKGDPVYRQGFKTDNGNVILDVHNLNILQPVQLEETLNNITGVVCHGLFAKRCPDSIIVGEESGVRVLPSRE